MRELVLVSLQEKLAGPPYAVAERPIALKDGRTLAIRSDGNMVHRDAAGRRVGMCDGEPMEARHGFRYAMNNDPAWQKFMQQGSLIPEM